MSLKQVSGPARPWEWLRQNFLSHQPAGCPEQVTLSSLSFPICHVTQRGDLPGGVPRITPQASRWPGSRPVHPRFGRHTCPCQCERHCLCTCLTTGDKTPVCSLLEPGLQDSGPFWSVPCPSAAHTAQRCPGAPPWGRGPPSCSPGQTWHGKGKGRSKGTGRSALPPERSTDTMPMAPWRPRQHRGSRKTSSEDFTAKIGSLPVLAFFYPF